MAAAVGRFVAAGAGTGGGCGSGPPQCPLLQLDPTQFERLVAQTLEEHGYSRVRVVGGAGDLQADLTALTPHGQSVVVQCKRYRPGNKIGSPAMQSFIGMVRVHHGADVGMIVATSEFTEPARQLGRAHGIKMIDGEALVDMVVAGQERTGASAAARTDHSPVGSLGPGGRVSRGTS